VTRRWRTASPSRGYLPEGPRFESLDVYIDEDGGDPLGWAFGALGVQDRARHFATLYLNDVADVRSARRSTRASNSCAMPNRWRRASPPSIRWRRRWPRRPR
jgi:hypothetical protein